ncbi:MAG: biopolymer transporter ExbD [Prevotella sp.]|nr:biopolymer transporter ExbD [Prevotella sp.]
MFKRKKREVPSLNTTSTADISFMLLILFLVTSSMDIDKGLTRQLPPITPDEQRVEQTDVEERNLLSLQVAADGTFTCNDEPMKIGLLRERVVEFVGKTADRDKHIIQLETDRNADYEVYFDIQNEIVAAYNTLRDQLARKRFGHGLAQCTTEQKNELRAYYPQRIAEVNNALEEGGLP